jgi:UDP-glucose 4-epimerase
MTKVAIVGSNGFIGRHLTSRLKEEKDVELFLFGRSESSSFNKELSYRKIDFYNTSALQADFKEIELVYWLVSETIPATSWNDPLIEIEKNLTPFMRFMEVVSKMKVRKVAFISSAGTVYGTTKGKVSEEHDKTPFSPYGIVKLTIENFLNYYKVKSNIQFDVYRVSNVYGEGQNVDKGLGIINTFLEKIIRNNEVQVFGDGKTTRNYIYVKDVAELLTLSLRLQDQSGIYNISSGDTLAINDLIKIIRQTVSEDFKVNYIDSRQSDNAYIDLDNSKILNLFGKFGFTTIEEGIRKTYAAIKNERVKN